MVTAHEVVRVDLLPWPDDVGNSGGYCYLDQLMQARFRPGAPRPTQEQVKQANEESVRARVQDRTIRHCWFHQHDWRRISSVAIHALKRIQGGQTPDWEMAERRLRERGVPEAELVTAQARKLLSRDDAIQWAPSYPHLIGNGSHRVCAMKAQRVEATVVRVAR